MGGEFSDTQNIASGRHLRGCTVETQFYIQSVFLQSHACIYNLEGKKPDYFKHKLYKVFLGVPLS